jgi:hypothetical protein
MEAFAVDRLSDPSPTQHRVAGISIKRYGPYRVSRRAFNEQRYVTSGGGGGGLHVTRNQTMAIVTRTKIAKRKAVRITPISHEFPGPLIRGPELASV